MGIGFTIHSEDGTLIAEHSARAGEGTNNVAEYTALLRGLREALKLGVRVIHVRGDSKIVVKAVRGEWRCREPRLKPLLAEILSLVPQFDRFSIEHVGRELNAHADRLSTGTTEETAIGAPRPAPPRPTADRGLPQSAEGIVLLTYERIEQLKTSRGGFTYATLRELGVEITDKGRRHGVIV
jgi:ribonuclease HI